MKATEQRIAESSKAEVEIRSLTDHWADAIRGKDFDAIMSHYAEDVTAFDVPAPLQLSGKQAIRQHLENWLNMFEGPAEVEFRDMKIHAGDRFAFLHTLTRVSSEKAGPESGTWVRVTVCYQKIGGKWLVTHEHASVPVGG